MKTKIITFAFLTTGFLLGASALFVNAQDGTWVPPKCPPPGCNVPEPVNVGIDQQIKLGSLILNADGGTTAPYGLYVFGKSFFNESIVIPSSTPTTGKVLAALNDEGLVGWQMPAEEGSMVITKYGPYSVAGDSNSRTFTLGNHDFCALTGIISTSNIDVSISTDQNGVWKMYIATGANKTDASAICFSL